MMASAGTEAGAGKAAMQPGSSLLSFRAAPMRAGLYVARGLQAQLGGLQVTPQLTLRSGVRLHKKHFTQCQMPSTKCPSRTC